MAQSKELPVKNIVNVGLLIAGFLVVRKVLTTFGIVKTAEEKQQEEQSGKLEEGSETQADKVDTTKPQLSLNPSYWKTLLKDYKVKVYKNQEIPFTRLNMLLNTLQNGKTWEFNFLNWAGRIYNSKGVFNDDESRLYNVFQAMRSQLQISYLSDVFQKRYKKDMLDYIKGFTNEEERAKLFRIIKSKPLY